MRFVIIKTSISPVCMCNLCSGCQGQSFFDQISSFTLFLGYTFGRPEWVSCQDNNSRFREDELTPIQLEIASSGGFHPRKCTGCIIYDVYCRQIMAPVNGND